MKATWILADGKEITADVPEGNSLMEAAQNAGVPGIIGECGGTMSCATCHVFVDESWIAATGKAGDFEDSMLDVCEVERQETSRLSCQLKMAPALDGIILQVP